MKHIFVVFGYGIPINILKDEHYSFYSKTVFNKIYDTSIHDGVQRPIIILCGGKTAYRPPYIRSEAEEMKKLFSRLMNRSVVNDITKKWLIVLEKNSLSTLENLLEVEKILKRKKIRLATITIFCEQTRVGRIIKLSRKIFNKEKKLNVRGIDFDISSNRYLDPEFLKKKEQVELRHSMWALRNEKNLKKHHKLFSEKILYLRNTKSKHHAKDIEKWWRSKLDEYERK